MPIPLFETRDDARLHLVPLDSAARALGQLLVAKLRPIGDRNVPLPALSTILDQAELMARAMQAAIGGDEPFFCEVLPPRLRNHVLSLGLADPEVIDHVLIWGPQGFDPLIERTLTRLGPARALIGGDRVGLDVLGIRDLRDLACEWAAFGPRLAPFLRPSRAWYSRTPYVTTAGNLSKTATIAQIQSALVSRDLPRAAAIEVLDDSNPPGFGFARFVPQTSCAPDTAAHAQAWAVRLTFERPIAGPIALGHDAWRGLGLFEGE